MEIGKDSVLDTIDTKRLSWYIWNALKRVVSQRGSVHGHQEKYGKDVDHLGSGSRMLITL